MRSDSKLPDVPVLSNAELKTVLNSQCSLNIKISCSKSVLYSLLSARERIMPYSFPNRNVIKWAESVDLRYYPPLFSLPNKKINQ